MDGLKEVIKNLIKTNPFLFTIWFHLYRKHKGSAIQYFNSKTQLYLDGFPRSGNTYSLHLIKTIWPDIHFIHHFHAIAPIKIALKRNIPVYILVRDPMNAITSWYLKQLSYKKKKFDFTQIDLGLLQSYTNE